jgi:predicted PurR-regulated permease PerM
MIELNLNERQKTVVKTALTLSSLGIIGYLVLFLFNKLAQFLGAFSNVLLPLATAAILALVLRPYYVWLLTKTKGKPLAAVILVFASVLIPIIAFLLFFGNLLIGQLHQFITELPLLYDQMVEKISPRWPVISATLSEHQPELIEALKKLGITAWGAGKSTYSMLTGLLGWAVLPVYLFFFLMAPPFRVEKMEQLLPFLKESTRKDALFLTTQFIDILVSFFRGQLVIALIQGGLFALGFSIVGLRFGVVLGLMLGLLNIVPYLGNIIGLSICIPLAFFQAAGGGSLVAFILLIFILVQAIEGYYLTPKIMGDRTGLHPLTIMVSIFFWGTALSGISGMLLAVPLTAFLVVFWRLAKEKYIHEWI